MAPELPEFVAAESFKRRAPTEATKKHGDISVRVLSRMDEPAKPFNKA
jgi:hypothetical protein